MRIVSLACLGFLGLWPALAAAESANVAPSAGMGGLILWLLGSMAIILLGCELFANAVEHVGDKTGLSHAAAGSLLAAVGTAMPETLIPILALIFGAEGHGQAIGIGAILGAPFMLSTIAFFLLGLTVTALRFTGKRSHLNLLVNVKAMQFELKYFLVVFILVFAVSVIGSRIVNYAAAALLLTLYGIYFKISLRHEPEEEEEYTDLFYFDKLFNISKNWPGLVFQLVVGLGAIVVGARIFVDKITVLSLSLGVSTLILALLIAPIATELPEKYNSVTWALRRKDTLALANLTGAMTFQSMIPVSIGLVFTDWRLGQTELINILFALSMATIVLVSMIVRKKLSAPFLLLGGVFYVAYIIRIVVWGG